MIFNILIVSCFYLFSNTPIRRSQLKSVTAICPVLVVGQVFPGKAGNLVGENSGGGGS
jgi:hypothetical protein